MRLYTVSIDAVAVSAAQDLINLTCTANMAIKVHAVYLGQKTLTTAELKQIKLIRFPATVTAGSGGSAGTIIRINQSDAAATFTARINDTTPMTTNSTAETIHSDDWAFLNGFFWMPPPEHRPVMKISQGFAINLGTAPSASMTVSGTVYVEELF